MAADDISVDFSTNAEQIESKVKKLSKSLKGLETANKKAESKTGANKARIAAINKELAADKKLTKSRQKNIEKLKQERAALQRSNGGLKSQTQIRNRNTQAIGKQISSLKAYNTAVQNVSQPRLRYALYDLSNNLRRVALASAAVAAAPVGVAIAYERAFANVIRTNELAKDDTEDTRDALLSSLKDIAQATPISWEEITEIATLAGQLGIGIDLIDGFTENVAKFAATTDLTVDAASTAFGRLNQLIDGVDGQFEELGSAILAVGVDSVATESQIVNVATNIASMGNLAQLSAADIVGLSGSMASLGIRPELARGNITRFFSRIGRAVAEGGFKLEEFSRLSGRSAEQFTNEWGTSQSIEIVLDFFDGLSQQAGDAERTLRDLGITSVRDIPALLRLAQSSDEVRRLVGLSNDEFVRGQKIQEQYAIIAGTTAEELRRLGQNFQTLLAALGAGSVEGFGDFFAAISNVVAGITDLLSTDVGKYFGLAAIGAAAFVAVITGLGALLAIVFAGFSALVLISQTLGVDLSALGFRALFTTAGLQKLGLGALTANAGFVRLINTIRIGTLALGVIGVALIAVGAAFSAVNARTQEVERITESLLSDQEALGRAFEADAKALEEYSKNVENGSEALAKIKKAQDDATYSTEESAKAAEEEAKAKERQEGAARFYLGVLDETNASGSSAVETLEAQAKAAKDAGDEYLVLGDNVAAYLRQQAAQNPELLAALEIAPLREGLVGEFGDFASLTEQLIGNPEDAQKRIDEVFLAIKNAQIENDLGLGFFENREFTKRLDEARIALEAYGESADPENIRDAVEANSELTAGLEELEAQAALADGEIKQLLDDLFGAENATKAAKGAVGAFFDELADVETITDVTSKSFQDMVAAIAGNEFRTVGERMTDLGAVLEKLETEGYQNSQMAETLSVALIKLAAAAGLGDISFSKLPDHLAGTEAQMEHMIAQAAPIIGLFDSIGDGIEEVGDRADRADGAAPKIETLAEQFDNLVNSMFETINLGTATEEAIFGLGEAFGETGDEALYASDEMQKAIGSILAQSGSAEEGVANLAALFSGLAGTVGGEAAPSLQILRQAISQVAAQFGISEAQAQQFIDTAGGGISTINFDNFNRGIQKAQQEVRTLLDYANDLESVFSRAFDIRFASTFAIDNIAEAWFKLGENVEDARREVEDLIASQQDLGADRALKEYFLSVADAYGDTLRAAQLRQEIADLDREQADNAIELDRARALAGGDLTGQGEGERQNRAALLGLVGDYQSYIGTLAESGASQDELRKATERARKEFIAQALELGYQEDVVLEYAKAFDDVRTAIDNVPRNITVDANVNPALQALNELNASLQTQIRAANDLNRALNQPVSAPSGGNGGKVEIVDRYEVIVRAKQAAGIGLSTPVASMTRAQRAAIGLPYYDGGFTGRGGMMQPAGVVHKGEYVVPQKYVNQSTGMPDPNFLAQLQNGMRGYQMGGFVGGASSGNDSGTMMVELSPYDRKLLSDAGNVQLRLNGKVVAEATNRSNVVDAQRGAN